VKGGAFLDPIDSARSIDSEEMAHIKTMKKLQKHVEKDLHRSKSSLVSLKSKQEKLRQFAAYCQDQVNQGLWNKYFRTDNDEFTQSLTSEDGAGANGNGGEVLDRRPLEDLLNDCVKAVAVESQEGSDRLRKMLAVELCIVPEVYDVVLQLLSEDPMKVSGGVETIQSAFGEADAELTMDGTLYDIMGPVASSPEKLMSAAEAEWDLNNMNNKKLPQVGGGVTLEKDLATYLSSAALHRDERREQDELNASDNDNESSLIDMGIGNEFDFASGGFDKERTMDIPMLQRMRGTV
jgi:hypothetical protein